MSLLDLARLAKRYWWLVCAITVAFFAIGFAFLSVSADHDDEYLSSLGIVSNTGLPTVDGIAANACSEAMRADRSIVATYKSDTTTMTTVISVRSVSQEASVEAAESIANDVVATAKSLYNSPESSLEYAFNASVSEVSTSLAPAGVASKYYVLLILGGLFLSLCILIVIDLAKRPVLSINDVQHSCAVPILAEVPSKGGGETLFANIKFAGDGTIPASICIIPVSHPEAAALIGELLMDAAKQEKIRVNRIDDADLMGGQIGRGAQDGLSIVCCEGLDESVSGAYAARESQAIIMVACRWVDSLKDLDTALSELELAQVELTGIVFVSDLAKTKRVWC